MAATLLSFCGGVGSQSYQCSKWIGYHSVVTKRYRDKNKEKEKKQRPQFDPFCPLVPASSLQNVLRRSLPTQTDTCAPMIRNTHTHSQTRRLVVCVYDEFLAFCIQRWPHKEGMLPGGAIGSRQLQPSPSTTKYKSYQTRFLQSCRSGNFTDLLCQPKKYYFKMCSQ